MRILLICTFACLLLPYPVLAQGSQLNPGDIAIIAFQSDNNDQFAFVSLVDLAPGTQIQFSEKGWNGSLAIPAFVNTTEGVHTWTAPLNGLQKATVVTVNFNSLGTSPTADYGSVSSSSAAKLSTSGDELIAFQGSPASPNFIYAFGSRPWINTGTPTSNQSWLPSTLVNGLTARDFATENDDQHFNLNSYAGSKEQILQAIGNTKNWIRSNARFNNLPDWHFQLLSYFFLKADADPTQLGSWGSLGDGSGNQPDSFMGAGKVFFAGNHAGELALSNNWQVETLQLEANLILSLQSYTLTVNELTDSSLGCLKGSDQAKLQIRKKAGNLHFDANAALLNQLTLGPNALAGLSKTLLISSNSQNKGLLQMGDSAIFFSNGWLVLGSNEMGSSQIQSTGKGAKIIGTVEVQKYIPAGRRNYRFMGHPFANALPLDRLATDLDISGTGGSSNGFTSTATNNPSAFWYDPLLGDGGSNDPGWMAFTSTHGGNRNLWQAMQGIRINIRGKKGEGLDGKPYSPSALTLHLKDSIYLGDQSLTLTKNLQNAGFNLVSNPFAADIDMHQLQIGSNINANYYLWDPYLGTMGGYSCYPFSSSQILPSFGAFFAQTNSSTSGNQILFPESCKDITAKPLRVLGLEASIQNQLSISIQTDSIVWDKHLVVFDNQASSGIDRMDAKKLMNPELNLYSLSSEKEKLCIDSRPITENGSIPLDIRSDLKQDFSLVVNQLPELAGYELWLFDQRTQNKIRLKKGLQYSFLHQSQNNLTQASRFEILLQKKQRSLVNETAQSLQCRVFPNPTESILVLQIHAPKRTPIQLILYNAAGQVLISEEIPSLQDFEHQLSVQHLKAGTYLIAVSNAEERVVNTIIKH